MEIALAILSILSIIIPLLVKRYYQKQLEGEQTRNVLRERDLTQLRADLDKLRTRQTPPPVP